jgi:hypothetical protein
VATGSRARPTASGPTVGPRLVPAGASPWAAPDQPRSHELRFVATELLTASQASGPAAGGVMEVAFQVPGDRVWRIERIAVSSTSAAVTTATVYVGAVDPANIVDQTPAGNGDIADETNPIFVPGNAVLRVRWTGATNGAVGTVRLGGWAGALTTVAL